MRHGCAFINTDNYNGLDYDNFMKFLLKRIDPPLLKDYRLIKIPQNIDIIYHSPILRAKQTAELIKKELNNKPVISDKFFHLLDEVKFSENIILRYEFEANGNFNNVTRKIILEKWYRGENEETFEQSLNRIKELDKELENSSFKTIVLITHGWLLRLIYLFYHKKSRNNKDVTKNDITLRELLNSHICNYGDYFEYFPHSRSLEIHKQPVQ